MVDYYSHDILGMRMILSEYVHLIKYLLNIRVHKIISYFKNDIIYISYLTKSQYKTYTD